MSFENDSHVVVKILILVVKLCECSLNCNESTGPTILPDILPHCPCQMKNRNLVVLGKTCSFTKGLAFRDIDVKVTNTAFIDFKNAKQALMYNRA